ncbi:MAG: MarC family protein [Bacteroidota bacterium]
MVFKEIFSVTLILFSIIDILGNLPIIISLKEQGKTIESGKATLISGVLMITFLFGGESILNLLGVDVASFAIAGAIIIFLMGMEMIMGITLFKESENSTATTIVPVAFPMIAGSGTLTTILSLRAEFQVLNIAIGIAINLIMVFLALRSSGWIQSKIGKGGSEVLRKVFGIILLAIAVKLFRTNLGI